jgi:glycosyltransferase involved in cell wall biosynthesis
MTFKGNLSQISVVIPTYNRSWGLIRSIESVLSQSFQDFELIIVDDCSPDDTQEVIQSIKDSRIHYFRQPQNVGVAKNWGTGLKQLRASLLPF